MTPAQAFDQLAASYDQRWTDAAIGRLQREAFWRHARPYVRGARRVLDIGCGTGADAARLMREGFDVSAIDVSPQMVAAAQAGGVDARILAAEDLDTLGEQFDAVISNFGVLNCVTDIRILRAPLANTVAPGGYAILCLLSRFCLWETIWFLMKGEPRKSVRRWRGRAVGSGVPVCYPSVRSMRRVLAPDFTLVRRAGIGICVPPSYVARRPNSLLRLASRIDAKIDAAPAFRCIGDHTLFVFRRNRV